MITRLTHAAIAFAVTAALYQAYVLAVAPFVEPAWRIEQAARGRRGQEVVTRAEALHRYRDAARRLFPAGALVLCRAAEGARQRPGADHLQQ